MPIGFMYDIFIPKIYWIWAYIRKKGLVGHGILWIQRFKDVWSSTSQKKCLQIFYSEIKYFSAMLDQTKYYHIYSKN